MPRRPRQKTKLYTQMVTTLCLVAITAGVGLYPTPRLADLRRLLTWTVTRDYDPASQARAVGRWATEHGGWVRATSQLLSAEVHKAGLWVTSMTSRRPLMPVKGTVLQNFGWLPPGEGDRFHQGMDLVAPVGTPVVAIANGTVTRIAADAQLGQTVEVNYGAVLGLYAQVQSPQVKVGDKVRTGQALALVGQPGGLERGGEPHLHFEIRTAGNRVPVDPAYYLGVGGNKL